MAKQLGELGFTTAYYPECAGFPGDFIAFKYTIPIGRFRGREVEIALNAPNFPSLPPSGPYFRAQLLPIKGGSVPPFDGIHDRKIPTAEFQYWSRPFNGWTDTTKNMRTYLAFLRTLLDFE